MSEMLNGGLRGRTAVVTGGSGGIGAQICRDLAGLGARVVIVDVAEERSAEIASCLEGATTLTADLQDPESVAVLVRTLRDNDRPDILISCAGWDKRERFLDSEPSTWDRVLSINLRAAIQMTHGLLPAMIDRNWGRLVFISSDAGRVGSSGEVVYSAAKAGVIGFSKAIARETARHGVTSNVVCPGPTDTPMLRSIAEGSDTFLTALQRSIPMRRLAQPDDVSAAVAYLVSAGAGYVTGQTLSVSGGLTMV